MKLYVIVAICLACLAAGTAGGWKARDWKAGADDKARMEAEAESARLRARQVDGAAQALEAKKATAEIRWRTITKEVERVIQADPVYVHDCVSPDGLRVLNSAIGARAASQPSATVPGPAASGAQ